MKKFSPLYFLTVCFLFFSNAFGQTTASSPSPAPTPPPVNDDNSIVKISTNLIQIDATVVDKNGKIVTGLTADDFEIYENGKKQPITNFSFVDLQTIKPTGQTAAAAGGGKSNEGSISVAAPPMGKTKLRPEQVQRTIALIIDDLGLSFASVDKVKTALKKYIDEQMQPGDLAAIIRTSSGAGVLQQFTSDKRVLYAALEKIRWKPNGRGGIGVFQTVDPSDAGAQITSSLLDTGKMEEGLNNQKIQEGFQLRDQAKAMTLESNRQFDSYREDLFAVGTLGAVNYVVKGMRELPGRKGVVLFSDGFGLYDMDNGIKKPNPRLMENFQQLIDLANRSSVIIYGADARGLVVPMPGADENVGATGGGDKFSTGMTRQVEELTLERSGELLDTQQGLRYLSEKTGGFAIINNNNLSKGVERVLNDQNGYYLIGYQPESETFDPEKARFNKIDIKLKRPELQVRYRSGFYGISDEAAKPRAKTAREQIFAALTSPFNTVGIDLQLTSLFANDTKTGNFMRSVVYIDGKDLKFTAEADGWEKATFDIVAMIFGDKGAVVDEISRTETIKARAETLREIREKGFVSTITFPIKKPGAYQMRIVLRDTATDKIGSASQFIEAPNLKKNRLTLSGILLQRVEPQFSAVKITPAQAQFQPDEQRDIAIRNFRPGTNVRFGYAIYNARLDKATKSPNVTMQFKIFRDGRELFVSREKAVNLVDRADSQRLMAEGVFTLGKTVEAGDYILQVIVKDLSEQGKKQIATQWIDFEVIR